MMRNFIRAGVLVVLLGSALCAHPGEVIDYVAATVNGRAILESELDDAARYQCLLGKTDCNSAQSRRTTLTRLIEQKLIEQQMGPPPSNDKEVASKIEQLKQTLVPSANAAAWSELLNRYGLNSDEVAEQVAREVRIRHFIDARFRPGIRIERASIEEYYQEVLLPEVRKLGAAVPSLNSVEARISEILVQQQIDQQLSIWLASLHAASRVEVR